MAQATAPILDFTYPAVRCDSKSSVIESAADENARGEFFCP